MLFFQITSNASMPYQDNLTLTQEHQTSSQDHILPSQDHLTPSLDHIKFFKNVNSPDLTV